MAEAELYVVVGGADVHEDGRKQMARGRAPALGRSRTRGGAGQVQRAASDAKPFFYYFLIFLIFLRFF